SRELSRQVVPTGVVVTGQRRSEVTQVSVFEAVTNTEVDAFNELGRQVDRRTVYVGDLACRVTYDQLGRVSQCPCNTSSCISRVRLQAEARCITNCVTQETVKSTTCCHS